MKQLFSLIPCALIALLLLLMPPIAFATDIDVLDVKTTFKIEGVDRTRVVVSSGTNTAIVYGVQSVTGSSTFNPAGIGTLSAVFVGLDTIADDARYVTGTSSGQNITAEVYGIGAGTVTAISSTPTRVFWLAIGTP